MRCVSTAGASPAVSLSDALLRSLAPDGGLYVPAAVAAVEEPPGLDLPTVARALLGPYLAGDALAPHLDALADHAWSFDAPTVPLAGGTGLVELFHGPTAAFKDYAARFLAGAVERMPGRAGPLTVLVATSGDTGAAVAAAFHGQPGVRVVVLHPAGRVSPRQAHHLGAFGGNVVSCAVDGDFDACQALVRRALTAREVPLLSANSLSLGRWLPQIVVAAAAAWRHLRTTGRPANLCVPTGNLGNATAALLARAMGAPLGTVCLATNANRTLAEGFEAHAFRPRPTTATLANAMDVGDPSNLARLTWLHPAPWDARVTVERVEDDAIRARIAETWRSEGLAVCPHTATGLEAVARRRAAGDRDPWLVYATAHAAKFPEVVEPVVGRSVPLPPALAAALSRPATSRSLPATDEALRRVLLGA